MSILLHGDCLELMETLDEDSVDLIFCDLPYASASFGKCTACEWDKPIDMDKFWSEVMRIKKLNTPIFFTCNVKLGYDLIRTAPKKCPFRYDIVWVKSQKCGFLSSRKMPLRSHEMVYVFYEKLPFYDLSSHNHKFQKTATAKQNGANYGGGGKNPDAEVIKTTYDPPLPTSIIKEEKQEGLYGVLPKTGKSKEAHSAQYDPPLPTSIVKEPEPESDGAVSESYQGIHGDIKQPEYITNNIKRNELRRKYKKEGKGESAYDPPLPTSIVKEESGGATGKERKIKDNNSNKGGLYCKINRLEDIKYDPPLPNSILEIKSTRGKHSTEKPIALMSWVLKYFSKEGDTILDPTMGSGSTGVACKNMNRNFIGIEMDPEIYEVAVNRIED